MAIAISLLLGTQAGAAENQERTSYYPHWVTREGELSAPGLLDKVPAGATIAVHHTWDLADIASVLDHPSKHFRISWYAESNPNEREDPASHVPVPQRIKEARTKQNKLMQLRDAAGNLKYAADRFSGEIELDAARDLDATRLRDAELVKDSGFRYLAKSPKPSQLKKLSEKFGGEFLSRVVFEDVVNDLDYRRDAIEIARSGVQLTLVIHHCGYDGDPGTTLEQARAAIQDNFNSPNVEAYFGEPNRFKILKSFEGMFPDDGMTVESCPVSVK